ncbi:MAG TPA: hypothetical protein VE251_05360, partial [Xanthobacteraceae bacterium]|nr:hypothetical protein [Xanthobacteraceae bacterium]
PRSVEHVDVAVENNREHVAIMLPSCRCDDCQALKILGNFCDMLSSPKCKKPRFHGAFFAVLGGFQAD